MNDRIIPWQPTVIAGPKQAMLVTPETAVMMIKKAKRPLMVVGPLAKRQPVLDHTLKIMERWDLPVVTTADTFRVFNERGVETEPYGIVEITNLLKDPEWRGVRGEGQHDLVIFIGCIYYIASQGLSTLKHFAPHIKTLTICKTFHSNADASFPNMDDEEWFRYLEKMHED
ncbi:CO dehydrogenase/acetyl-CoA synthase complex subunit epsilon [Methanothermobacter wolfeii]|uniref:Acetyl-CoA decarbonylase/synthase complex subunit epsilon n=1 Tax=Methanothermobacter wolfeii TaxID=145261 RepID=A0A9E7UN38_METWO|nr:MULTISPECIES: CO dehydrogenase/acetyl-CoA synthase complex subunit epsilon [Methanothermobacter]MDI6702923.1 CO dehydrogenase/acetyl-CoA synthase complex subunit epsilon [Methanothermobacter wolfeii]MDI6841449.1 CO dehydrogenase/acetyl-CoA synthase complex subunit epsilon [Methanothermobacter wolfeii]NLM03370.1 CO dehydrogenase/acetyl-CoA synthase complex subunit epsilon [Methanothermobacter wolfeii]QHN05820.1 CO dehydrogenase/acetyl-CoA synthase complex subunit epsilon [Methanothermobacter 